MLDRKQNLYLIFPLDYDANEYQVVKDLVKEELGGDEFFKKDSVKVIQQKLIKDSKFASMKETEYKNINIPFINNFTQFISNFTQKS